MSRPPWPQIRIVGEWEMSIVSWKWVDWSSGVRVREVCFDRGREVCVAWRRFGRRNARMNVLRLVGELVVEEGSIEVGIEGMYLMAGKRRAEAVEWFVGEGEGLKEEFVTRMLLKGC
jgi:hypothetical protein